jgi:hypothetical protein
MPRIIAELHGLERYTWVVTAYILATTTMIPIVGKLSDQFGRKWFLLSGTILFLLGSLLAGASQSMNQLIAFRALQGLGAGIGMALVATVIGDLFPPTERAKWMGLFGVVYGTNRSDFGYRDCGHSHQQRHFRQSAPSYADQRCRQTRAGWRAPARLSRCACLCNDHAGGRLLPKRCADHSDTRSAITRERGAG